MITKNKNTKINFFYRKRDLLHNKCDDAVYFQKNYLQILSLCMQKITDCIQKDMSLKFILAEKKQQKKKNVN